MLVYAVGILAESNTPDVTLPVPIALIGTRAESNVPDVILPAARFGISPVVSDILSFDIVPLDISLASSCESCDPSPLNFVALNTPVEELKV